MLFFKLSWKDIFGEEGKKEVDEVRKREIHVENSFTEGICVCLCRRGRRTTRRENVDKSFFWRFALLCYCYDMIMFYVCFVL